MVTVKVNAYIVIMLFHLISTKSSLLTFSADIEDIKKAVNCPMKDTTVPIKFWPPNQKMEAIVRRHSCVF